MAHPLNRPVYDAKKGRVVDGYGILQPRASISLASSRGSRFTRLFAGEAGIDPYTREISDVYQDLFGEGSFVGKGIYDVEGFSQAVQRAVPGEPHPQPRSHRGRVRPLGSGGRRRPHRGAPRQLRGGGQPETPLDEGRLAARRLAAPARARTGRQATAQPAVASDRVEAVRQPAAQPPAGRAHRLVRGRVAVAAPDRPGCGRCWSWERCSCRPWSRRRIEFVAQTRGAQVVAARGPYRQVAGPPTPARSPGADLAALRCAGLPRRHRPLSREHARHPARVARLVPPLLRATERPPHSRRLPSRDVDSTGPGCGTGPGS